MNIDTGVNTLTDDQALLLQWVNTCLETGVYREWPRMAELMAITLYTLIQAIDQGPLRRQLDLILTDLRVTIREMQTLLERRTH
ncbi:hypothetical protein [Pseudomonas sp. BF-R-21]|uniref:hypothetical protein n=1 Tax=Pseudomonas sp. BF-R-21 TaxID=2832387 RepID=UPI001CC10810|nr:hypothetical protein [Pseudomonas sp. BF-R-21]